MRDFTDPQGMAALAAGPVNSFFQARQQQQRNGLANQEMDLRQRDQTMQEGQYQNALQNQQREQGLRQKLSEMEGYANAPPEIKAQYVAQQAQQNPEFAQTPFAKMDPVSAFDGMHRALQAQLGMQPKEQPQPPGPLEMKDLGGGVKVVTQGGRAVGSPKWPDAPKASGGMGMGGEPAAPIGNPALTGDAYLQTLPAAQQNQVKALAEGRMAFPGGFALKAPYWQQMLSAVAQYDPNFDAVNYNARAKTRSDFTSGKNAQNIKSLNTAIGHLGALYDQIGGTASHGFTPLNTAENAARRLTGDAGPTKFAQTAGALASELTQVFRGSGGAEADVKRYLSELDVNGSKEQKLAAVNNIVDLLNSRLSAIGDQYNQGMGTTSDPLTLLNPKAQSVFKKVTSAAAPSNGPAVGSIVKGYRFKGGNPADQNSWEKASP